jgi:predicted ribosome quality control (RQC) complex YloA/Tae2 family protein
VPGSHCLLLLQPGEVATDAALQFGADVAAWHSKARGNSDAPVTYTSPRHLKKITGGGPGMVSVMKIGGVLRGRPDRGEKYMAEHLASSQQSL